jgi:hypothetical protein
VQPLIVAEQTRQGIADFLKTTFPATTPGFETLMARFLAEPENLAKGPYVTVGLPFKPAPRIAPAFAWAASFNPHAHQARAFARLTGAAPRSTLIATGTGSGKTECFLFPVLEHARQMRSAGRRGVKAILIYPMNALAIDQANRVAREIVSCPELRQLTAGLYVGDESEEKSTIVRHVTGERYTVITDRDRMRQEPPDILLTNYKMVDFLLLRARDAALWRHNEPDTLRYLVVDELHAYDGAQGTDLACLIRRLKGRLATPLGALVGVGTSATLGSEGNERLLAFAADVFGEPFDADAVIGEERESVAEYLRDNPVEHVTMPTAAEAGLLSTALYATDEAYIAAQIRAWFADDLATDDVGSIDFRVHLGRKLKQHVAFQNLLRDLHRLGGRAVSLDDLVEVVRPRLHDAGDAPASYPRLWLGSLLALIAHAARGKKREGRAGAAAQRAHRAVAARAPPHGGDVRAGARARPFGRRPGTRPARSVAADSLPRLPRDGLGRHAERDGRRQARARPARVLCGVLQRARGDAVHLSGRRARRRPSEIRAAGRLHGVRGREPSRERRVHALRQRGAAARRHRAQSSERSAERRAVQASPPRLPLLRGRPDAHDRRVPGRESRERRHRTAVRYPLQRRQEAHRVFGFRAGCRASRGVLRGAKLAAQSAAGDSASDSCGERASGIPGAREPAGDAFDDRWLPALGSGGYVRTFLPPAIAWLRDYQAMTREDAPPTDYLVELTRRGVVWAMLAEFGQDAHVGRTLPRTLTASVAIDAAALERAASACT